MELKYVFTIFHRSWKAFVILICLSALYISYIFFTYFETEMRFKIACFIVEKDVKFIFKENKIKNLKF